MGINSLIQGKRIQLVWVSRRHSVLSAAADVCVSFSKLVWHLAQMKMKLKQQTFMQLSVQNQKRDFD